MGSEMRLDKFISGQLAVSRKDAAKLIKDGEVSVGGITVLRPEAKIEPDTDAVSACGKSVPYAKYIYIMMNKPAGVLSASEDKRAETVMDLLPAELRRRGLFPAGRLDKDTTGLLIITDDGAFAHNMLSPKKHVVKRYEAVTERDIEESDIREFEAGIIRGETAFAPGKLWQEERGGAKVAVVEIGEGKYHQVKRMFEAVGNRVISLRRVRIGSLDLDESLSEGAARILTNDECKKILGD